MFEAFFSAPWSRRFRRGWSEWSELGAPFEGKVATVDVIAHSDEIVVRAELPGDDKDDLEVSLTDDTLSIEVSTAVEKQEEKGEYYHREITRSSFSRIVRLPAELDGGHATTKCRNGVLEMKAPKLEGNLAMFANCERSAKAKKLSRVRGSQPLGSVLTGRRKPEGKISGYNEVKDVCPESEPQPREG